MKRIVIVTTCIIATALAALTLAAAAAAVRIPRWQPHDFSFTSTTPHGNPFMVRFSARATGPEGVSLDIPGFYDGDGTWKTRLSPTLPGRWTVTTSSDDPALDGKSVTDIECVPNTNPAVHGALQVDKAHPYSFIYEDGTPFFLMGYECDWLWALDSTNPKLPTVNALLDKIRDYGFDYVILNVYAHDTKWRKGATELRDYGPPPVYPWLGSNDHPDQTRLGLPFWQHFDRVIDAMYRRGIVAHILTKVYNKDVNWPAHDSPEEDLYYRTLAARYAAYPNVVWDFSKEAHNEKDFDYKARRIRFIRANDPYKRLLTVHDDNVSYDRGAYTGLLDYRSDQQHKSWHKVLLEQRAANRWPVVNVEFGYEWGPKGKGDSTYPPAQSPEEVVSRAWQVYMAGGYGAYYYTYTAWDIIHPNDTPPGYTYFKRLRDFFARTGFASLEPSDSLVNNGYCLARPGVEYVVYQSEPCSFTLSVRGVKSSLKCEWYNPLTGVYMPAGTVRDGDHTFTTPLKWKGPVVMHIGPR